MISKNLIKSSITYTVVGALPLLSAFLLLIFYTNYISVADYGAFVLYISFTLFIQILVNFGLDTYIGISYFENKHDPGLVRAQIGSIVAYLLVIGLLASLFFLLIGKLLFGILFQGKDLYFFPYGFMSVVTAIFNSFFKTYSNLLINQERPVRFAVVNFANFIMTLAFSLSLLFTFPHTLIGPMWGRLLSGAGIFLIALFSFKTEYRIRFRFGETLQKAFSFSLPVVIFFLLSWLISNVYPYIMKYFMSLEDVAIFGLALQFTLLIEFVVSGLSNAIMPRVYDLMKTGDLKHSTPEMNKYFSTFNAVTLLIIPLATLMLPIVLPLIINKNYEASYPLLAILNISFASRGLYHYFIAPVYFQRKTKILPKVFTYTAIFQLILAIVLIKFYGIWGAVWANLVTKIIQNVFLYMETRRHFRFTFNSLKLIGLPLIVTLLIVMTDYLLHSFNLNVLHAIQLITTYCVVILAYRKELIPLYLSLKSRYLKHPITQN